MYLDSYDKKIVVSGNVIEVYQYEESIYCDFKQSRFDCTNKKVPPDDLQEEDKESIKQRSLIRSKMRLRRLINANGSDLDKFVTLTFARNITSVDGANREFKNFIKRLKYNLDKELKYIAVIQFQERGSIHYHILFNCDYIPHSKLEDIWGNGFVKINQINGVDNVGAYVVKYMKSELENIPKGKKRYFHSRNLNKPKVIKNHRRVSRWLSELEDVSSDYETVYDTEYLGKIKYQQYKV